MPIYFSTKSGVFIKLEAKVVSQGHENFDALREVCRLLELVPAGEVISGPEIRGYGYVIGEPNGIETPRADGCRGWVKA